MQSLLPFRWLALVCVLGIVVGYLETHRQRVDIDHDQERNYPRAMAELYPGTARAEYLAGRQAESLAMSGVNAQEMQQRPELLEKFLADYEQKLKDVKVHYEKALAAGLRSEEDLQYNYALALMQLRADPAEIERAIASWRRDFPHSDRDLKAKWLAIEDKHRKQDQFLARLQEDRELDRRRQQLERMYGPGRRGGELPPGRRNP
jgi:hypothetical protein